MLELATRKNFRSKLLKELAGECSHDFVLNSDAVVTFLSRLDDPTKDELIFFNRIMNLHGVLFGFTDYGLEERIEGSILGELDGVNTILNVSSTKEDCFLLYLDSENQLTHKIATYLEPDEILEKFGEKSHFSRKYYYYDGQARERLYTMYLLKFGK